LSDDTWPYVVGVSMLRKLTSMPVSCFMRGWYVLAGRRRSRGARRRQLG
jgi:hypothetical protein